MKRIVMLLLVCGSFVGLTNRVVAQGEAAVAFLLLAPDSRAGGMGEAGAALADNSSAVFWNPAGIAFLDGVEVSVTHSNWLPQFNLDLFYDYLTMRYYMPEIGGSITGSITYMNYGEFVRTNADSPEAVGTFRSFDVAATVGYATKVTNDIGLGFNFRIIHSQLADQPTGQEQGEGVATSVSFDAAFMWRPEHFVLPYFAYPTSWDFLDWEVEAFDLSKRFSLGVNLSNLGPKIYYIDKAQADPIPTNFRLGLGFLLYQDQFNSLTFTADFSKLLVEKGAANYNALAETDDDEEIQTVGDKAEFYEAVFTAWGDDPFDEELRDIVTSMGFEYWYGVPKDFMFALRGGYFYEDPSFGNRKFVTFGAGLRYDMYGFDFSYINTDVFEGGENHPLSGTLRFTLSMGWGSSSSFSRGFPRGN